MKGDIIKSAFSGDGRKQVFFTWDRTSSSLHLYMADCDGQGPPTEIPLPPDVHRIGSLTINHDGTRAFFSRQHIGPGGGRYIFRVDNGSVSPILDAWEHKEINACFDVKCTADGSWVYSRRDRDECQAHAAQRRRAGRDHPGRSVGQQRRWTRGLCVRIRRLPPRRRSHRGGSSRLPGRKGDVDSQKRAICFRRFVRRGLTDDEKNVFKSHPTVSADGQRIVFAVNQPKNKWYATDVAGSREIALKRWASMLAAPSTGDGGTMFYFDFSADGGRFVETGVAGHCAQRDLRQLP